MNVLFFGWAIFLLIPPCTANNCDNWMRNYSAIERALLTNEDKLVHLEEAFYPTNGHDNKIVNVRYRLESNENVEYRLEPYKDVLDKLGPDISLTEFPILSDGGGGRVLRQISVEINHFGVHENYVNFGWLNSPTDMFINPTLLKSLSLITYTPHIWQIVELNFSVPCSHQELQNFLPTNSTCPSNSLMLDLLNHLTTNLRSYFLHRSSVLSNGMPEDKEKGFSVYYYDSSKPSGYCILNEEGRYESQRKFLGIGISLLLVFILCASPLGFIVIFKQFRKKMKEQSDLRFFVWSLVIASLLVSLLIISWDIRTFIENFSYYPSSNVEGKYMYHIHILFILVAVLFGFCLLSDIIFVIVALKYIYGSNEEGFVKDIPIPLLFKEISKLCSGMTQRQQGQDGRNQGCCSRVCAESVALGLGNVIIMVFMQLCGFHVFFITLGALATPVSTLSIVSFYIAFYFCLVTFIAVLLKTSDAKNPLPWMLASWAIAGVIGVIGLVCIGFLIAYFYNYIHMVEDYNYSNGVLVVLGRILPTCIATFLAFCGSRLVKYVGNGDGAGQGNRDGQQNGDDQQNGDGQGNRDGQQNGDVQRNDDGQGNGNGQQNGDGQRNDDGQGNSDGQKGDTGGIEHREENIVPA